MLQKWIRLQYPYFFPYDNCFPKPVADFGNKTGCGDWESVRDWIFAFQVLQFCGPSGVFFIQIVVWLLISVCPIHSVSQWDLWLEKKVVYAKNGFGFVKSIEKCVLRCSWRHSGCIRTVLLVKIICMYVHSYIWMYVCMIFKMKCM